jgi:hypothetical protein
MDGDRKYKSRGYMDENRDYGARGGGGDKPRGQGPKPPLDITGPRLPRMVQTITASRCWNCSITLGPSVEFKGECPKCGVALHCCKQCAHFEPSTRFQCLKPVPARVAYKDQANECELFSPRVTVAREATTPPSAGPAAGSPRTPADARAAFDSLFNKNKP